MRHAVRVLLTLVGAFVVAAVVFRWLGEKARWSGISPDKQARIRADELSSARAARVA